MTRPLRIALLTGEAPASAGGVGDYSLRLAEALVTAGHEVGLVSPSRAGAAAAGVDRRSVSSWVWTGATAVVRETRAVAPDVVLFQYVPYLYSPWGLPVGLLTTANRLARDRAPVVLVAHEPFNYGARTARHRAVAAVQRSLLRALARRCAAVVVTTEHRLRTVSAVVRRGTRMRVIPVGATLPGLDARPAAPREPRSSRAFRLTVFGRLELARRRPDVVHEAAARLASEDAPVELELFGPIDGATDVWRRTLAERPGLRVACRGPLAPEAAASALASSDATVAFDTSGLGGVSTRSTVAANAFAARVPLAANAGPDTDAAFVDGENLLLCEPRPADLAQRLATLRASAPLCARLAGAGRRLYDERLCWRVIAAKYEVLSRELTADGP